METKQQHLNELIRRAKIRLAARKATEELRARRRNTARNTFFRYGFK